MKKTIRLIESELRRMIKNIVNENIFKNEAVKRDIFTLNILDIIKEESIDDMQYTRGTYYTLDDAIDAAKEIARHHADYETVVNIFVMAGEYETETGDVYGEPEAIYCISNKGRKETAMARKKAGYSRLDVDDYIDNVNEAITRTIRKYIR